MSRTKGAYLMSKIVLVGFEAAWFFAASPTNRSSSVKATYEGVIRFPGSRALARRQLQRGVGPGAAYLGR